MNVNSSTTSSHDREPAHSQKPTPPTRAMLGLAVYLLTPLVLFVAAGDFTWLMGWVYVLSGIAASLVSRFIVMKKSPELLQERGKYRDLEGVPEWDRRLMMSAALLGPLITCLVAGLNYRFAWQPALPLWLQIGGIVCVVAGFCASAWAMIANRYFSAVVRIQTDRGHQVVSSGPYAVIRHPGYAGAILAGMAAPLMLDTFWALAPAILTASIIALRTQREDRFLQEQLPGYKVYSQAVRFRLLPGVY